MCLYIVLCNSYGPKCVSEREHVEGDGARLPDVENLGHASGSTNISGQPIWPGDCTVLQK